VTLPDQFLSRYAPIAPEGFAAALEAGLRKTLRVNLLKTSVPEFKRRAQKNGWDLAPLGFAPTGFAIERADRSVALGHSLEHFAGHFYIQEASSMIPPQVLDPQPGETVLDLAAAPGSKTTQLSAMMQNTGIVVANDVSVPRIKALTANLERSGCLNVGVSNLSGARLGRFAAGRFDRVLVDAPCSAEGTLAKSPEAMIRWSEKSISKLATIQSKLLAAAYLALKPGGTLVYSTCTFAPEENEGVVSAFLTAHPEAVTEPFELPGLPLAPGVTEWQGTTYHSDVAASRRVWPGPERMEGFFICRIRKPAGESAAPGRPFADRR
jgi:16S rRNA (cytosine1407-C5)-methyltransferase